MDEDVLLHCFSFSHPKDLIRTISLVSTIWRRVAFQHLLSLTTRYWNLLPPSFALDTTEQEIYKWSRNTSGLSEEEWNKLTYGELDEREFPCVYRQQLSFCTLPTLPIIPKRVVDKANDDANTDVDNTNNNNYVTYNNTNGDVDDKSTDEDADADADEDDDVDDDIDEEEDENAERYLLGETYTRERKAYAKADKEAEDKKWVNLLLDFIVSRRCNVEVFKLNGPVDKLLQILLLSAVHNKIYVQEYYRKGGHPCTSTYENCLTMAFALMPSSATYLPFLPNFENKILSISLQDSMIHFGM